MKILGGKEMLRVNEPKLIYGMWHNTEKCRKLLSNPTPENVLAIIERAIADSVECSDSKESTFNVWVCDNSFQVDFYKYDDEEYDEEDEWDGISMTDNNVVGDASPTDTLWFVFEKDEWKILDEKFGLNLSQVVGDIWDKCKEHSTGHSNEWAKESLDNDSFYRDYLDIIEANIKVNLC